MNRSVAILVTAATVAAVAAAAIGAYSQRALLEELITHRKTVTATDLADLTAQHKENDSASIAPRPWMAPDATHIRLRFVTTDDPGWNVQFTSKTGLTPDLLAAGKCVSVANAPKPALTTHWPRFAAGEVHACDDGAFVTHQGDTVYGWQSNSR